MTPKWTFEERVPLHHLFALIGYLAKDDDWWRLYEDIQRPTRGRTVIYEDWRFGGLGKRGEMWKRVIRVPVGQYTREQRIAFDQSRADIDAAAIRLGITLPTNPVAPNAQTASAVDLLATPTTTVLPTSKASKSEPIALLVCEVGAYCLACLASEGGSP